MGSGIGSRGVEIELTGFWLVLETLAFDFTFLADIYFGLRWI